MSRVAGILKASRLGASTVGIAVRQQRRNQAFAFQSVDFSIVTSPGVGRVSAVSVAPAPDVGAVVSHAVVPTVASRVVVEGAQAAAFCAELSEVGSNAALVNEVTALVFSPEERLCELVVWNEPPGVFQGSHCELGVGSQGDPGACHDFVVQDRSFEVRAEGASAALVFELHSFDGIALEVFL